jgi:SH3 domain protein
VFQRNLDSGESTSHKIVKMLPSGARLTLLDVNKATGYSKVKTAAGVVGYLSNKKSISQIYPDI